MSGVTYKRINGRIEGMYDFHIDREKKLLVVTLEDFISSEESITVAKQFWSKVAHIGQNSIIICDIRKLKSGSRPARLLLQKLMKLLSSYRPKAVIRVLNNYNSAMVFDRAYNNIAAGYQVYRVDNYEEALQIADSFNNIPPVFDKIPSSN